jgi:putative N6-adenine-specific DNA methylase
MPAPFATPQMRALMQRLKSQAQTRIHAPAVPISASDVSFRMLDFARRNAQRAARVYGQRGREARRHVDHG